MKINKNDVVTIFHFSDIKPFRSIVMDMKEDIITLKLVEAFLIYKFGQGDCVVLGFQIEGKVHMANCEILKINTVSGTIEFHINKVHSFENERKHERFYVSLPAEISTDNPHNNEELFGVIIEDISLSGMKIISNYELPLDKEYNLGLCIGEDEISLRVEIIRMNSKESRFEYGLRIIGKGKFDGEIYDAFVKDIETEQEKAITDLINS